MDAYWFSGSPFCWRVLLALELKGLPYQSKRLDASNKEHKAPEFLRLNPRGTVPVLRDGSVVVRDSLAIMAYLEKKHPLPPLFGATPTLTARIWERIGDHDERFHPCTRRIIRPLFRNKVSDAKDDIAAAAADVEAELVELDRALFAHTWLVGDGPTAAEVVYYPTMQRLLRALGKPDAAGLELPFANLAERFTGIAGWLDQVAALPGVAGTRPPHWD